MYKGKSKKKYPKLNVTATESLISKEAEVYQAIIIFCKKPHPVTLYMCV
jgi:hypothetical protein